MNKGKFIVIYGINNLGKSTQAKRLVAKLVEAGHEATYVKYPVYNLKPSGVMINSYLREGNPWHLTPKEVQILYSFNRAQYEPQLVADLEAGVSVVAEDYWGTGVAWGTGAGVDANFLKELNGAHLREDLGLLFLGQRFSSGFESGHLHESDDILTRKVDAVHRELASESGWITIEANQTQDEVADAVWSQVKKLF